MEVGSDISNLSEASHLKHDVLGVDVALDLVHFFDRGISVLLDVSSLYAGKVEFRLGKPLVLGVQFEVETLPLKLQFCQRDLLLGILAVNLLVPLPDHLDLGFEFSQAELAKLLLAHAQHFLDFSMLLPSCFAFQVSNGLHAFEFKILRLINFRF